MTEITKSDLYELYWDEKMQIHEIADRLDRDTDHVTDLLGEYGIPTIDDPDSHGSYVASMLSRHALYALYWGPEDRTLPEIADLLDVTKDCLHRIYDRQGVPRHYHGGNDPWTREGIPTKYAWPNGCPPSERRGSADVDATGGGETPEDPDPSKYLADVQEKKDELYQLYWGYGLPITEVAYHLDYGDGGTVKRKLERHGIPHRPRTEMNGNRGWRPHHGVPPMFEWPSEKPDTKRTPDDTYGSPWRQPSTGD